jgi:hypothetical protein
VLLLVGDLVLGWRWWHIGLAAVNAVSAVQLARGALRWHEPKRALSSTDQE